MAVMISHGDRGGCGKSTLTATLGECILHKGLPLIVVDSDTQNPDASRYFNGSGATIHKIDLRVPQGWREVLSLLEGEKTADVLVNLPAGIGSVFDARLADLINVSIELKRSLAVFWVMNRTPDSISLLAPVLTGCANSPVQIVAVRNLYFGDTAKFTRWNESKTREKLISGGGLEIDLEELDAPLVDATFGSLPPRRFSSNGETGLTYGERYDLGKWMQKMTVTIDGISERVGIGRW